MLCLHVKVGEVHARSFNVASLLFANVNFTYVSKKKNKEKKKKLRENGNPPFKSKL